MNATPNAPGSYDIAIIGGALAGAAMATLLLREQPKLRVLIVERSTKFGRRVGEASVEISGYFLGRVLGLTQHLNESHLVKQGMRFWFTSAQAKTLEDCSEIGGRYMARVPAYQIDRAVLDEEVLRRAGALGAEVWRPAAIHKVDLMPGGEQKLTVRREGREETVTARWVVDASGFTALLARQEGWWRPNPEHPTAAAWARWKGVKDWDGLELAQKFPRWAKECYGVRGTATNHLTGDGWWAWLIPLKGGDVSVGVVFDQRLVQWPESGAVGQRLKEFLLRHPVGRELLADAQWLEGDVHWRKNLAYSSSTFAGDGFVLVGDAAAFLDPFYSPGMDWISFTVTTASRLVLAQQRGEAAAPLVERYNRDFARSYRRWFEAVYKDKYEYMGEYDIFRAAFLLDLGLYYLGVAAQPFKRGIQALTEPVFSTPPSTPFYHLMRLYNRRFARIARSRRARGRRDLTNAHRRFLFGGYTFAQRSAWHIAKGLAMWGRFELTEGWRTWFKPDAQRSGVELAPPGARQSAGDEVALGKLPERKAST
jgi:flavin-dependent dehydrogenase